VGEVRVLEPRVLVLEDELDQAGGAVALLGDDQLRLAGILGVVVIDRRPDDEHDHIRILLDRTRLTEV